MATNTRILVIEDEADLAELVSYNLRRAGYEVETSRDGVSGIRRITDSGPDLVVLDVMLPGMDGLEIARRVRTNPKTAQTPILMLTAKGEEHDQVSGLGSGADDYVTKPFSMKVLLARVEAMLRRTGVTKGGEVLELGGVRVDLGTHEVLVGGEPVRLTLTELRILVALMRARGKVVGRADLMYTAMGPDVMVTARTIDVHVAAIRKKLGEAGSKIRTIRGVGYLFDEARVGAPGDEE